jgi:hypothetical protein
MMNPSSFTLKTGSAALEAGGKGFDELAATGGEAGGTRAWCGASGRTRPT